MQAESLVRTAILGLTAEQARHLHQWLKRYVQPVLVRQDLKDAIQQLVVVRPEAVLLYVGDDPTLPLQFCRRMRVELPDVPLVILAEREDHALTREAIRMGARALVVLGTDDDQDLARAFMAIAEDQRDSQHTGQVGVLVGAKGGVGTTLCALNVAAWLCADPNQRVALVDLSPQLGEHGLYLALDNPCSLRQLTRDIHTVDEEWLTQHAPRHPAGFTVFSQPLVWSRSHLALAASEVPVALGALARHYTAVVVDAGLAWTDLALAALAAGNQTALITASESASLIATRRLIALFRGFGHDPGRALPVLCLSGQDHPTSQAQIRDLLGTDASLVLRHDAATAQGTLERGELCAQAGPFGGLAQDLAGLTALLFPDFRPQIGAAPPKKKRLFGLL